MAGKILERLVCCALCVTVLLVMRGNFAPNEQPEPRIIKVTSDYTLDPRFDVVFVEATSSDVTITVPAVSTMTRAMFYWDIWKVAGDYHCTVVPTNASDMFFSSQSMWKLSALGAGVRVRYGGAFSKYGFKDISFVGEFNDLEPETTGIALSGTDLTMDGNIDHLEGYSSINVFFQYRKSGDTTWSETTKVARTSNGSWTHTATVTAGSDYECRAAVETPAGEVFYGAILTTKINYYDSQAAAQADNLVRYWPFQESSAGDAVEKLGTGDDLAENGTFTYGSDTINGQTIYHRIFGSGDYLDGSYAMPSSGDVTVMIQVEASTTSGDHTVIAFGRNVLSIGIDNTTTQLEVDGRLATWTSSTPYGEIKTLFIVVDRGSTTSTLYELAKATTWTAQSKTSIGRVPGSAGTAIRVGNGFYGDNNHQNNEQLDNGKVRSVAVWEKALTAAEMEAIAESLNDDGGLLF